MLIRIWIFLIESESVLVEAVGAVVTFLLLVALLLRYRFLRNREDEDERQRQLHPEVTDADLALLRSLFRNPQLGLNQEIINSLYCFKYSARNKEDGEVITGIAVEFPNDILVPTDSPMILATRADIENQTSHRAMPQTCCSVCLAEYMEGDELMMLPCQHAYHKVCVSEWLQRQSQCPLCKQDVLCLLTELGQLPITPSEGNYRELNRNNNNNHEHSIVNNGATSGDIADNTSPRVADSLTSSAL